MSEPTAAWIEHGNPQGCELQRSHAHHAPQQAHVSSTGLRGSPFPSLALWLRQADADGLLPPWPSPTPKHGASSNPRIANAVLKRCYLSWFHRRNQVS